MIERLLGRLVGAGVDVEDLLQETFTQAIIAFPRFRGESSVRTWLCRIAVHTAHAFRNNAYRRHTVLSELAGDRDADPRASLDSRVDARRELARLYAHLDAIPEKRRVAFILHVLEDLTIEVVAYMVGASKLATASRVYWARRELLERARADSALHARLARREAP